MLIENHLLFLKHMVRSRILAGSILLPVGGTSGAPLELQLKLPTCQTLTMPHQ